MKKYLFIIIVLIICSPFVAGAISINTNFVGSGNTDSSDIGGFINNLYVFALGISGVIAVGMIVVGSIYYSVSGGSPDKQNEGKNMISSALWGLLLLFGSYLILNTVNPELVKLKSPSLKDDFPTTTSSLAYILGACSPGAISQKFCTNDGTSNGTSLSGVALSTCLQEQSRLFVLEVSSCNQSYSHGGGFYKSTKDQGFYKPNCGPFYIDDCTQDKCPNYFKNKDEIDKNIRKPLNEPPFGNKDLKWC